MNGCHTCGLALARCSRDQGKVEAAAALVATLPAAAAEAAAEDEAVAETSEEQRAEKHFFS